MSVSLLLFTTMCESPASEVGQRKSGRAMWFINKKRKANTLEMIQWCRKKTVICKQMQELINQFSSVANTKSIFLKKGMSIVNS